jgi:hypothetical protein
LVAEFWSEITQDKDNQDEDWFYAQEGKDVNLNKNSFGCSFLLGSWKNNQGWSFPFIRG